jgi:hypothetical protein
MELKWRAAFLYVKMKYRSVPLFSSIYASESPLRIP